MKFIIVALSLATIASAQRPTYAGSGPIGRPGLANRFKDQEDQQSSTVSIADRIGEGGTTPKIPVDALGDHELVDRLKQWPREHQPFWLLNADQIEAHRGSVNNGNTAANLNAVNTQRNTVQNRNTFDFDGSEEETFRPRPASHRSSFLGPLA